MHGQWFEKKSNNIFNAPNTRSLTPKINPSWREETERTPERIKTEYSPVLSFSPAPNLQQKKNSGTINPTSKALSKISEINGSIDKLKAQKQQKSPNQLSKTYVQQGINHHLKTKLINTNNSISNSQIQTNTSSDMGNNENNYLNQITIMMQKIVKYKQEIENFKEKENQYNTKLAALEKENKSLYSTIEDMEKKMQDIQKKAKEDKVKMYQFLTEIETYKEQNAELQKKKEKEENVPKLPEFAEPKKPEKAVTISKCIQTIENVTQSCQKCEVANNQCQLLVEKLFEIEESSRQVIEDYNLLKQNLDNARKQETGLNKMRSEMEGRYKEMQKEITKQNLLCNTILAENSALKNTITLISDDTITQSSPIKNKEAPPQNKISYVPSCFKALSYGEKINSKLQIRETGTSQDARE